MATLQTPPHAIFTQIQANLRDRYDSGFDVLKELIQNAEDAQARIVRVIASSGWADAKNPLLKVPGLLVVNDGWFRKKDKEGILSFAATAKGDETAAIGRFGFGQKAVFHLCDAFVAHAFGHDTRCSEVINPCLDVIPNTKAQEWDSIERADLETLEVAVSDIARGFLLWVPLRCEAILPAPKLSFTEARPMPAELVEDFLRHEADLRLMLASLRHVDHVEMLHEGQIVLSLHRDKKSTRMLGPDEDGHCRTSRFTGTLATQGGSHFAYVGREGGTGSLRLEALAHSEEWPQSPVFTDQGRELRPEKAVAHGAVVLAACGNPDDGGTQRTTCDWGVFLSVADAASFLAKAPPLKLLLHGYFFVDPGRRYIEGFGADTVSNTLREKWNEALRDDVVLPLVPSVLHDAFTAQILTSDQLGAVVAGLRDSSFGRKHAAALAARDSLVRAIEPARDATVARWKLVPSIEAMRPLPAVDGQGRVAVAEVFTGLVDWAGKCNLTLFCGPEAALTSEPSAWMPAELTDLLAALEPDAFFSIARASALADFAAVAVGDDADRRTAAAAKLLATLRRALADIPPLAPEEPMRRVMSFLPERCVIGLPKTAGERYVLRALAGATTSPLCLRREWLVDSAAVNELSPDEAAPLLTALQPLLEREQSAEAAGVAALALVKLMRGRLYDAAVYPKTARLRLLRAGDGSGTQKLVSLQELVGAAHEQRLFKDNPVVHGKLKALYEAAPGTGALVVSLAAASLLDEIGEPFAFTPPTNECFARLVLRAASFGQPEARRRLLDLIFTDAGEARAGLRALAAGDKAAAGRETTLVALPGTHGALDNLALDLLENAVNEFLIEGEITSDLKPSQRRVLGIIEWDGAALGRLLTNNSDQLAAMPLDDTTVSALLASGVPDADLRSLPIFADQYGKRRRAGALWRETRDWPVPTRMTGLVPLLRHLAMPIARDRAERLVDYWSPEQQIKVAFEQPDPHKFATEILAALVRAKPLDLDRARRTPWLYDRSGAPWAPENVLDMPDEVLEAARGVLGTRADLPFLPVSDLSLALREQNDLKMLRERNILLGAADMEKRLQLMIEKVRPIAFLGDRSADLLAALVALAQIGIDLKLPGWPLLAALLRETKRDPREVFSAFGDVGHDLTVQAVSYMNSLAELAKGGSPEGWIAYRAAFKSVWQWPMDARRAVLAKALVCTEAGLWRPGREVSARGSGLARSYLLHPELRKDLPRHDEHASSVDQSRDARHEQPRGAGDLEIFEKQVADGLRPILAYAAPHVPADLLVLLVGLLGQSEPFRRAGREVLGSQDADISRVWKRLADEVESHFQPGPLRRSPTERRSEVFVVLAPVAENPKAIETETLSGEIRDLPLEDLSPMGVLGDIHIGWFNHQARNGLLRRRELRIATPPMHSVTSEQAKSLCLTLAEVMIGYPDEQRDCLEALATLADACDRMDQTTVESARAELEDQLPRILAELKPRQDTHLRIAWNAYDNALAATPPGERREQIRSKEKRLLWQRVNEVITQRELIVAVRERIEDYGYDAKRVLFELFQNADDASIQHPSPGNAHFWLEISPERVRALYWGRLINHLGPEPAVGARNGWQRDLFNMLLMNLSEKREAVTGRFGLGFKSLHLIAQEVGIASRFVACRVRGGMLPEEWKAGRQLSHDHATGSRPATLIDLEIDPNCRNKAEAAVVAFRRVVRWLPAMSRMIRKIEIAGAGIWAADHAATSADGIEVVTLSGSQPGQALALGLGEEITLFLPLNSDGPIAAEEGLSRLWLMAPLEESLDAGWLMNGMCFRVDPGRGQLAGTKEEQLAMFARLGTRLGGRLVSLYDLLRADWPILAASAGMTDTNPETGGALFLRRLVDLFARDFNDLRAKHLHGPDRGLGCLIGERSALPTGLPLPFAPFVSANDVRHELTGALTTPALLADLCDWAVIESLGCSSVGRNAAEMLTLLGFGRPPPYGLDDLLRQEIGPEWRIGPALADRLGRLLTAARFNNFAAEEQSRLHALFRKATFQMADEAWRKASLPPRAAVDADDEERRVLAFAPDAAVAGSNYTGPALTLYRLAAQQSGFQRTAAEFAAWAETATETHHHQAFLRYVVEGHQGEELGERLTRRRPYWLPESWDALRIAELLEGWSKADLEKLYFLLYREELSRHLPPDLTRLSPATPEDSVDDPRAYLERLHNWWLTVHPEERQRYDKTAYPGGFLPSLLRDQEAADDPEGWFTFFALGIFRTIGRSQEGAHRNFVAAARHAGWWREMAEARLPDDPRAWISRLEDFARADAWRIDFPQWRRALADLYVLARWLPDYVDAFRALSALVRKQERIALSDAWRLSASPIWQRRGLEGAPLTQSLGIGANWMIREAIRHGLWPEDEARYLHPYAWASTKRVRDLFSERLGHPLGEDGNMDMAPEVYRFVQDHLDDRADFLGDLDLPLQIATDERRNILLDSRRTDLATLKAVSEDDGDVDLVME